jgi:hypothetical protein
MKTISPYLITKLYTWTAKDLNEIFDKCFTYNNVDNLLVGPSSTYAIMLAALIETWGSIINDKFGRFYQGSTEKNVKAVMRRICELDDGNNKENYLIFDDDNDTIQKDIVELFRHNLIHDFGKKPKGREFDLNIDCSGLGMNQQDGDQRWHLNCKKLKEDFLNVLRLELPSLLNK